MIFGHQPDDQTTNTDAQSPSGAGNSYIVGAQPTDTTAADPAATTVPTPQDTDTTVDTSTLGLSEATPAPDDVVEPTPDAPIEEETPALPATTPSDDAPVYADNDSDDLLTLKQQALSDLGPLLGHLDQSPEEKFRTTMMLIQTTDNQSLIKDAYTAAQAIPDENIRAQALLDVVNEINYFTQHTDQQEQ